MKRLSLFLILFTFSITAVSAASVQTNVSRVQTASSYTAPSGYEDKGFIGSIIADIFDVAGRIQNQYVSAFQIIQGILINNIPRWDGQKFVEGTITDNGTNVGIGTNVLTERLNVNGRITTNLAPNSSNDVGNVAYNDGRYINVGEEINGDDIQDNTIDSSEIQNNTITNADIADGTVRENELAQNQIDDSEIQDNSLTAISLAANSVGNSELNNSESFSMNGLTVSNDASINSLTVGKGAGNISSNTVLGISALRNNTTGRDNIALGASALQDNTTGRGNTAIGRTSLLQNTTGVENLAIGNQALRGNTTGIYNTGIGNLSVGGNGSSNVGVGWFNMRYNQSGTRNTSVGTQSLYRNTTGSNNVGLGGGALLRNTSGSNNIALGTYTLNDNTTGSNNIAIGYNLDLPSPSASNRLNIGNWIYGNNGDIGIGTENPQGILDITNSVIFTGETNVDFSPDMLFSGRGLVASESKFSINIDSDNNQTDANFSIRSNGSTQSANNVFTVFENGNVNTEGKIRMRTQTSASDSNDTVATKGYVDAQASGASASLGPNSVNSGHVVNNSLTASDLGPNSVGNSELQDSLDIDTIVGVRDINGNYGGILRSTDEWLRLNDDGGHTSGIYTGLRIRADGGFQVDGVNVIGGDAWVEGDRIRQGTIDGGEIQNNSLTASDIAANSINNSELADDSVSSANVINNSLTASDIAANAIRGSELDSNSVTSGHIVNGTITRTDLATNAKVRCTNLGWNQGIELSSSERPDGNRYMIAPQSANYRCQQKGYDIGFARRVFGAKSGSSGWCGFSNARVAYYSSSPAGWKSKGCTNGEAVSQVTCCHID